MAHSISGIGWLGEGPKGGGFGEEGGAGFGEGLVGSVSGDGRSMADLRSIESVCTMDPSSSCTFDTATPNMAT